MKSPTRQPQNYGWDDGRHLWILRTIATILAIVSLAAIGWSAVQSPVLGLAVAYVAPIAVLGGLLSIESVFLPPR